MELSIIGSILPEFILDYFSIMDFKELSNVLTKKMEFEVHLDEKNKIHKEVNLAEFESKGFLPSSRVKDFPIQGKSLYLVIRRRRRWRHKETKSEIHNDISFVAKGIKLTEEISDFLKGTGQDPRRYYK